MVDVDARVLPTPAIQFSGGGQQAIVQPQNGAWEMNGQLLLQVRSIEPALGLQA